MKRTTALLLLTLMLLLTVVGPVLAAPGAAPPDDSPDLGFIPDTVYRNRAPLYDLVSVEEFRLDGQYSMIENITEAASPLNTAASLMLMWNAIVVKLTVRFLEWAFTTHLVDVLLPYVEAGLAMVSEALLASSLVKLAFFIAGGFALYQMARGRVGQAVWAVMGLFLLLIAFGWLLGGGLVHTVTLANDASVEVSGAVMAAPIKGTRPTTEDAVIDAGKAIFTTMAIEPWAIAEFSSLKVANVYGVNFPGDIVMSKSPELRKAWYKALPEKEAIRLKYWKADGTLPRFCIAAAALLSSLIFGLIVCGMALALIGMEIWLLILVFVGPGIALGSYLMSWMGWSILGRWVQEILGTLAQKIALAFGIGVVLLMYRVIHFAFSTDGWLLPLVLQIVMVVMLFINRRRLARIFTGIKAAPASALERYLMHKMMYDAAGSAVRTIASYPGRVRERRQQARLERKAKQTLMQQLGQDELKAQRTGRLTPLMKRVKHRMQLGAKQPFTQAEIRAEAARVRALEEIGADSLAVAAGAENTPAYWSKVDQVQQQRRRAERELRATRGQVRPLVRRQAFDRSAFGKVWGRLRGGHVRPAPGQNAGGLLIGANPHTGGGASQVPIQSQQSPAQGSKPSAPARSGGRKQPGAQQATTVQRTRGRVSTKVGRPAGGPLQKSPTKAVATAPGVAPQPPSTQPPSSQPGTGGTRQWRRAERNRLQPAVGAPPVQQGSSPGKVSRSTVVEEGTPATQSHPEADSQRVQVERNPGGNVPKQPTQAAPEAIQPSRRAPLKERKRRVAAALAKAIARRALGMEPPRKGREEK